MRSGLRTYKKTEVVLKYCQAVPPRYVGMHGTKQFLDCGFQHILSRCFRYTFISHIVLRCYVQYLNTNVTYLYLVMSMVYAIRNSAERSRESISISDFDVT